MFVVTALALSLSLVNTDNFDANLSERSIVDCLAIEQSDERLACYDRTATLLRAAMTAAESDGVSDAQIEKKPGILGLVFGKDAKKAAEENQIDDFGNLAREDDLAEISDKISSLSLRGDGVAIIVLENGQIWQQLSGDSDRLRLSRREQDYSALIKKAALGSYRMRIEPLGKTIRVRRVK